MAEAEHLTHMRWTFAALTGILLFAGGAESRAHTLPNFSEFEVERKIEVTPKTIRFDYQCKLKQQDRDEQTTSPLDLDQDGVVTPAERKLFLEQSYDYLTTDLVVFHQRELLTDKSSRMDLHGDGLGFRASISADLQTTPSAEAEVINIIDPAFLMSPARQQDSEVRASAGAMLVKDEESSPTQTLQIPSRGSEFFYVIRAGANPE